MNRYIAARSPLRAASKLSARLCLLALAVASLGLAQLANTKAIDQTKEKLDVTARGIEPTAQRESWRKSMVRTARPKKGCFVATFPEAKWREVQCKTPPNRPYPPKHGIRPDIIGAGTDFSAAVTTHVSQSEGSFDSLTSVTSESANGTSNAYSLQLNTQFFTTSTCSTSPTSASCQGWEQFVYSSQGFGGFIQYWLLHYGPIGTNCPAGWTHFVFSMGTEVYCYINSVSSAPAPAQAATALAQLKLFGAVAGVNGAADDSITVSVGGTIYTASGDNHFPDLGSQWTTSEFNVFGDGGGDQANFNSGASMVVRTSVDSGMPSMAPNCLSEGFTGETNNLTLVNTPIMEADVNWPSVRFTQTNTASPTPASCATADAVGDTHLKKFNGLLYDFQAAGEFLLVNNGSDFVVQTRQASGAPTWPNTSVNKAVATQMGRTRIALYIEPVRLVIDGRASAIADGKTLLLADDVQLTRRGNAYEISSASGNRVRAVLNSTWVDVTAGLGRAPQAQVRGLLGNPTEPGNELRTSRGIALREPVSFTDLYHSYADGWRVPPNESLFAEVSAIRASIPDKPFLASHLNPQQFARARAACTAAHVTTEALLEACTLDHAVLNDQAAVRTFIRLEPPRFVIKPVFNAPLARNIP